ncbi:MAG TPA: PQQ-binding-like beta-propeller repeat protein, partial [Vicinamibacterales bacterium]|nr:PQQ-binding-like beta-propeller repeat protein [Vicinamibacterales bacterium]
MADVRLALVPLVVAGALAARTTAGGSSAATQPAAVEWRVYCGSPASDRFSPLAEITPANVAHLEEAWRFDTGETGGFQVNPIVVDSVLYSPTPNHRVVALDAATGT